MTLHAFVGTWEVIGCGYIYGTYSHNQGLEGVRFELEENGDVNWTVPEEHQCVPLFSCETYEIYSTSAAGALLRFGAYAGHVLEFKCDQVEPGESLVLTCENWCVLHCKRVFEETQKHNSVPFSLLPALEDGYFSDLTLTAANKKQFKVHLSILKLQGSGIDWKSDPGPFSNLPEAVLGTILHFMYAECLPENLSEATAQQVVDAVAPYPGLSKLVNKCNLYLKNMVLKQQIFGLVNDMHASMDQIIEYFNIGSNHASSKDIASNPSKLCFVVKQSIREAAVAAAKLLLLCDLFTKRKGELSKEERHEIVRFAKSRLPVFLTQLMQILSSLKDTFSSMSASQRLEVATFLVPEIEIILNTVSALIVQLEKALQHLIQVLTPNASRGKYMKGDALGKSLRNILHIRELTKLKHFHEHITYSLGLLIQKRENFNELTAAQKIRSMARNLEQMIEELPIFLRRLGDLTTTLDEKPEWREFKFCFKVGTSKISGILQKLVAHRQILQEVVQQLCELVHRESFNQSLYGLGLLDPNSFPAAATTAKNSTGTSTPNPYQPCKLNLVKSLCVPPGSSASFLAKSSLHMFKSGIDADMEFEVAYENEPPGAPGEEEVRSIKAHRVIVAARCDWFRRALQSGMREAIDKKIVVHDTSPFLFRIFLEYLYSGRLKEAALPIEQIIELLLISDRYEVDSLKQTCEYAIKSSIDVDSVLYFFNMADQYNAPILKDLCLSFIAQHTEVTESEVFFELPVSLQAQVFDCVWTQPTLKEQLFTPTSLDSIVETDYNQDNSGSEEYLPMAVEDTERLDACISLLRGVVGESAPREALVQVALAADYDTRRALNFYYSRSSDDD